jgi:hypothetical protein
MREDLYSYDNEVTEVFNLTAFYLQQINDIQTIRQKKLYKRDKVKKMN